MIAWLTKMKLTTALIQIKFQKNIIFIIKSLIAEGR